MYFNQIQRLYLELFIILDERKNRLTAQNTL